MELAALWQDMTTGRCRGGRHAAPDRVDARGRDPAAGSIAAVLVDATIQPRHRERAGQPDADDPGRSRSCPPSGGKSDEHGAFRARSLSNEDRIALCAKFGASVARAGVSKAGDAQHPTAASRSFSTTWYAGEERRATR